MILQLEGLKTRLNIYILMRSAFVYLQTLFLPSQPAFPLRLLRSNLAASGPLASQGQVFP